MATTGIGQGENFLYGYVNGEKYMVTNTVDQICAFIMKHRFEDVTFTDVVDMMEITTSMGFIFSCRDQEFLMEQLQPALIPMQRGEAEVPKYIPYESKTDYVINNIRLQTTTGYCLGSLIFEEGYPEEHDIQTGNFSSEEELAKEYPYSISHSEAMKQAIEKGWMEEWTE